MMEEEEWDTEPTVEELITSVLKSKRKLGRVKLPPRPARRNDQQVKGENSPPETDIAPKAKTEELESLLLHRREREKTSNNLPVITEKKSGMVSKGESGLCMSTGKMVRSVSTPEIRKCLTKPTKVETDIVKSSACRQMEFDNPKKSDDKETTNSDLNTPKDVQTPSTGRLSALPPSPPVTKKLEKMGNIVVNDQEYLKLSVIGRGGSSKVYEVLDVENRKVKAMKVVDLEGVDKDTLLSYKNEISILTRLQWSDKVIHLYNYELASDQLKLVMEKGNGDLASILSNVRGKNGTPLSPFTIQHYWEGMLRAVQVIHQEGIIHSDLKPANFLLVNGTLKLIDFGISSSIQQDMTSIIKDSQAGTFNYMSPESLLDVHSGPIINNRSRKPLTIKIGVKSDVWSLGCILYNMVYGRTPFQHISSPLQKLIAISDPKSKINFPEIENEHLIEVLKMCLRFEPHQRPSIAELLEHPYLKGRQVQTEKSNVATPQQKPQLKSMMDQLAQLTPSSFEKVQSMMTQLHSS